MPPIFKGINPFKWGSDIREYIYDHDDLAKDNYQFEKQEPHSSKTVGGHLKERDLSNCRCVFPSRCHQIDCLLYRSSCPLHSPPVRKYSEPTVTISFHPSDQNYKLLEPVKSILTSHSERMKLKYYLPGTESGTEILKKPLISGPSGESSRKIKSDADVDAKEKFMKSVLLEKDPKERTKKVNRDVSKNKGPKNEQYLYYSTAAGPSKPEKIPDQYFRKNSENNGNVCDGKNCPGEKKNVHEGLKGAESDASVYFTPYMLVDEESPLKNIKTCCSCSEVPLEKNCALRKTSDSKINVNFQFGNFNGREVQVMTTKKNMVQVVFPEVPTKTDKRFQPFERSEDDQHKHKECPCPPDENQLSDAPSSDLSKIEDKAYQPPEKQNALQLHIPNVHESRTSKFAETQTDDSPESKKIAVCPVCEKRNLKDDVKKELKPKRLSRTDSISPVRLSKSKKIQKPQRSSDVGRMYLDDFQTKKKQAWERNEYARDESHYFSPDNFSTDPNFSEYSTTETDGNMKCIAFDCQPVCKPCKGYQVYVTKTPEPNNLALKNIFPLCNDVQMLQNYFPKQQNDRKEFEREKTLSDFDDLLQMISEKFSKKIDEEEEEEEERLKKSESKENNFIDVLQYRQACKAEKKNSVKVLPVVPILETFKDEKTAESVELDYKSLTNVSEETEKKDIMEKYTMTSDAGKLVSEDEMVTLQIKVSKTKR